MGTIAIHFTPGSQCTLKLRRSINSVMFDQYPNFICKAVKTFIGITYMHWDVL